MTTELKAVNNVSVLRTAAHVADDALEFLRSGRDIIVWMTALNSAIRLDIEHGRGLNVEALTSLAQYIGEDWGNHLENEIGRMQEQLEGKHPTL
ncbi:hypothetical protein [Stutzerimonas azotifigens]|uniref:hypothetical protein n=1 Tax=Stutzerimonas azotifigens TaxID=291995 RepID=UPI000418A4BD|nr:hypothetical protein [Stutzerimonas azotifigens]